MAAEVRSDDDENHTSSLFVEMTYKNKELRDKVGNVHCGPCSKLYKNQLHALVHRYDEKGIKKEAYVAHLSTLTSQRSVTAKFTNAQVFAHSIYTREQCDE
jgi:hypothetical protein